MSSPTERIRALNDQLRQNLSTGLAVLTTGVAALGPEAVDRIVKTIGVFDDFCHANDPHEEHDFGAFEAEGETIFFKIDYFDNNLSCHSPVRANRLGWAVVDIKGPKNSDIGPKALSRHYETFLRAGIPQLADIAAIRSLLWRRHLSRRG